MGEGVPTHRGQALVGDRMVGIGHAPPVIGPIRGDIHIVDFPDVGGNVIRGPHPGVIVQTGTGKELLDSEDVQKAYLGM